ncbi:hypothetical protein CROQUDRAFT_718515 [Cronartium quercuum f. sp. fusiforme G11]|uniref:Urease accessory protein UreF n=1 Tax=Cronartium quercuum f. sp. fusiforme G11 TaxID=708437 RepID=A0A9P6NB20_9BASI|nr:hypothetical protein CROQUDRAFT_718515 [Cronartium quercuum f. sp. fusiforme G11]
MSEYNTNSEKVDQIHLINILSDSNLPVGGFVSSSGLESFISHSFLATAVSEAERIERLISFTRSSLLNYASLAIPFMNGLFTILKSVPELTVDSTLRLDRLYHAMCLNPVTRRSSLAQGSAMILLYTKAFSTADQTIIRHLKDRLQPTKRSIHLPIAYALVSGLLGLSRARAIDLHMFLYVRSILSAAVRLNLIGPYLSQRILFSSVRPMLDSVLNDLIDQQLSKADQVACGLRNDGENQAEDNDESDDLGPTSTWPLGDILAARHDLCHVRLFNS